MNSDNASDSADIMDTSNSADDQAEDIMDGDSMPNDADATDTNVFEIITQTQTSILLHSELIAPNPEQIPLAKSDPPPESPPNMTNPEQILLDESDPPPPNPSNPLGLDSPDAHP